MDDRQLLKVAIATILGFRHFLQLNQGALVFILEDITYGIRQGTYKELARMYRLAEKLTRMCRSAFATVQLLFEQSQMQ